MIHVANKQIFISANNGLAFQFEYDKDNNQYMNFTLKEPSPTAQSNQSNKNSPDLIKFEPNPAFDSYEHELAIQIMTRISSRTYYRQFIKKLTFAYIYALKEQKTEPKTVYVEVPAQQSQKNVNWPFSELYFKKKRTFEEEEMLEFANLCATMIQANFKGYITQKRHKKALAKFNNVKKNLKAFLLIWKAKRVYNCARCHEIKLKYRQIERQINIEEDSPKRDPKKLLRLNDYLEFNASLFRDTYEKLYNNGMWVLEENMKPMKRREKKKIKISPELQEEVIPQRKPKRARERQFKNPKKVIEPNEERNQYIDMMQNHSFNPIEERPIVAKGKYEYNDREEQKYKNESQAKENIEDSPKDMTKEEQKKLKNPHKDQQMQKLKKRQKYDPRKAIEEEKKKKKTTKKDEPQQQKQTKQNKNTPVVQKMKADSPEKKKITITKNQKSQHKKVQSKVDCWGNTKKQTEKQWIKEIKQRLDKEKTQKQESPKQQPKNYQYIQRKQEYIQRKQEIEAMEKEQQEERMRRNSSNMQLKNQVREMIEKNNMNKKKQVYRPVEQLQETYSKHYGDRYQNLMPKLGLLSVARGTQHQSRIPVIDSYSESFNAQLKDIMITAKFWQIATRMQKTFKQFIVE